MLNLHGSLPPLVVGLWHVRLPMMGSAVGGVRLPGPPQRGEEWKGGGGEEGRGEVRRRRERGGEGEGAEGGEERRRRRRLVL